ncbi:alpha-ribazole phosphatase [Alkalicella caledoniensis]|uniref:Alpha-ribazole phosphatase n=1 Tax=Alkalicella caledoniensis TaxID=2731377 RepID=A0A7G9W5A6_ALKCA|nr:alpha-ribazole phosphatase [Alkalicella caledoniensis]QNO13868.1 alpha-ribazole phosphatase [Alkalicella caledoniensis]
MTLLYLVRHGETVLNQEKVYYGRTDCLLNNRGLEQGDNLKNSLSEHSFEFIISSPLQRCVQTAQIISGSEQEILLDHNLVEIDFGLWEGLHHKEISKKFPKQWKDWNEDWQTTPPPGGESFIDMYSRVKKSIYKILSYNDGKKILLVSHKGCLQLITSILLTGSHHLFWNFTFEHGKYSVLELKDGHCTIKSLNCC